MKQTPPDSLVELLLLIRQCSIRLDKAREEMSDFNRDLFEVELKDIEKDLYETSATISEVILGIF